MHKNQSAIFKKYSGVNSVIYQQVFINGIILEKNLRKNFKQIL